jgi:cytochrome d ubiquinol oxidase subunit II
VWLIFVIVVSWTAYSQAFAAINSTLTIPLFVAAIGIIIRGSAYALRGAIESGAVAARVERVLGGASVLTPFMLGATVGGIASGRVPAGGDGDMFGSWLNSTSIAIGLLSVTTGLYLAAVYLAADAARMNETALVRAFRVRAIVSGVLAGALAFAALIVVHEDARPIWDDLTSGWGLVALIVSAAAGVATLVFTRAARYERARWAAALAVAAVVAGWGIAQSPDLLPGLTVHQAASGHDTLVALLIGIAVGAAILAPSLTLLFRLLLQGRFDAGHEAPAPPAPVVSRPSAPPRARLLAAGALLVAGVALALAFDTTAGLGLGILALLAFIAVAFAPLAIPPDA